MCIIYTKYASHIVGVVAVAATLKKQRRPQQVSGGKKTLPIIPLVYKRNEIFSIKVIAKRRGRGEQEKKRKEQHQQAERETEMVMLNIQPNAAIDV